MTRCSIFMIISWVGLINWNTKNNSFNCTCLISPVTSTSTPSAKWISSWQIDSPNRWMHQSSIHLSGEREIVIWKCFFLNFSSAFMLVFGFNCLQISRKFILISRNFTLNSRCFKFHFVSHVSEFCLSQHKSKQHKSSRWNFSFIQATLVCRRSTLSVCGCL